MRTLKILILIFYTITSTSNANSFNLSKVDVIAVKELNESVIDDNRDFDYEASCLLRRIKPEMGTAAVHTIRDLCKMQSYPKKCRGSKYIKTCTNACKEESYFSRKFGECSIGD